MKTLFSEIPHIKGKSITLKPLSQDDEQALSELVNSPQVYKYLPAFLFECRYPDAKEVISRLYTECLEDSLILGIYKYGDFCGLAELYGYRESIRKISVGYRLLPRYWGQGIATEALGLITAYLYARTDIEIITASTMTENTASARVLRKNGFEQVVHAAREDWGYENPTVVDKWIDEGKK